MTEAALQTKIDNADSDTSMSELLNMLHSAKEYSYHSLYDSAGLLPAADSANIGRLAFAEANDGMYVFVGMDSGWRLLDSDAETAAGPIAPAYAGENYGFSMGGGSSPYTQKVEAYSFASDGNSTDVGSFNNPNSTAMWSGMGGGTTTKGYHFGGSPLTPTAAHVYEFTYAAGTPVTTADAGFDISPAFWRYGHYEMIGNRTEMYVAGGYRSPANNTNVILKMPEASASTKTDVGNLTSARRFNAGHSSDVSSYASGGYASADVNIIDKWPMAADADATDVGDLVQAQRGHGGTSSSTHGYAAGYVPNNTMIQKFPFASDANATDVANLNQSIHFQSSTSSDVSGYSAGGTTAPAAGRNNIQKHPFAADTDATDVGDLTFARQQSAGTHY